MNGIRKLQPRLRDLSISPEFLKIILSAGKVHVALFRQLYETLEPIAKGKRLLLPYLEGIKENSMEEHARIRQVVKNINMHISGKVTYSDILNRK